jgi:hypothetical protein
VRAERTSCLGPTRAHELVRVRLERHLALLLWKGKAHERLVTGERQIDDLSDAELDRPRTKTSYDRGSPAVSARTSLIVTAIFVKRLDDVCRHFI